MSADDAEVKDRKSIYPPSMKNRAAFEEFGVGLLTTLTLAVMSAASPQLMGKFRTLQTLLNPNYLTSSALFQAESGVSWFALMLFGPLLQSRHPTR